MGLKIKEANSSFGALLSKPAVETGGGVVSSQPRRASVIGGGGFARPRQRL